MIPLYTFTSMFRWSVASLLVACATAADKHSSYAEDFKAYDLDGNGLIDPQEIRTVYGSSGELTEDDFFLFWIAVDPRGKGSFNLDDFISYAIKQDASSSV